MPSQNAPLVRLDTTAPLKALGLRVVPVMLDISVVVVQAWPHLKVLITQSPMSVTRVYPQRIPRRTAAVLLVIIAPNNHLHQHRVHLADSHPQHSLQTSLNVHIARLASSVLMQGR